MLFILLSACGAAIAAEPELVNLKALEPTLVVELRYATSRNLTGRALYPADMPALLRPEVAERVLHAHTELRVRGYGLKIWDAYRPKAAHDQLWNLAPNVDYVANPASGGSLHTWGIAVDATLVDLEGRELQMPTDFDEFTPAAMLRYHGPDETVRRRLRILQSAMARAGFYGMRTEWWHFVVRDWKQFGPVTGVQFVPRALPAAERSAVLRAVPAKEPSRAQNATSQTSRTR